MSSITSLLFHAFYCIRARMALSNLHLRFLGFKLRHFFTMKIVALLFSKALVEVNIIGLEGREVSRSLFVFRWQDEPDIQLYNDHCLYRPTSSWIRLPDPVSKQVDPLGGSSSNNTRCKVQVCPISFFHSHTLDTYTFSYLIQRFLSSRYFSGY